MLLKHFGSRRVFEELWKGFESCLEECFKIEGVSKKLFDV